MNNAMETNREKVEQHRIGFVQGRLSPIVNGKIQAFPALTWRDEFAWAREDGFNVIEWVLDTVDLDKNPLLTLEGRKEILQLKKEYNIDVPSICADYFMQVSIVSEDQKVAKQSFDMLTHVVSVAREVNIKFLEVPLIGDSSVKDLQKMRQFREILTKILPILEKSELKILLEMDLSPDQMLNFFSKRVPEWLFINYDCGNSAYWKYDLDTEMENYGNRIANVHIKDCTPESYSVPLGEGAVDFDKFFSYLRKFNYQGDFILQSVRGENHRELAKKFQLFTQQMIERHLHGSKVTK